MAYPERIETKRLILRRWEAADGPAMEAIWREPEVWNALQPQRPFDPNQWRSMLERHLGHWEQYGFGLWAVAVRDEGRVIGWIGASHPTFIPQLADRVEIGWTLRSAYWGIGLATEGAAAAVDAAFANLGLDEVISLIDPANDHSIGVATRLGMDHVDDAVPPDFGVELRVYALSRSAWRSSSNRGASPQSTSNR